MSQIRENKKSKFSHPISPCSHCSNGRQGLLTSIADAQRRKCFSMRPKENQTSSGITDLKNAKVPSGSSHSSLLRIQSPLRSKSYQAVSKEPLRLEIAKPPRILSQIRIISAHAKKKKKNHPHRLSTFFILPQPQLNFLDAKQLSHPEDPVLKRQKEVISQYYEITTKNQEAFKQLQSCGISEQVRMRKEGKVRISKNRKEGKESKKSKPKPVESAVCKLVSILKESNPDSPRGLLPALFATFGKSA